MVAHALDVTGRDATLLDRALDRDARRIHRIAITLGQANKDRADPAPAGGDMATEAMLLGVVPALDSCLVAVKRLGFHGVLLFLEARRLVVEWASRIW
jgi:hypothetical protein